MKKYFLLLLFLIIVVSLCLCQNPTYKNLVFEGAGIRGIAYADALMELENNEIINVGGTSAGAIIATAII